MGLVVAPRAGAGAHAGLTNAYPAFSPDGLWVAYMSTADGDFDIYAINPTLGIGEQLTDAPERDGTPTWSPDGRKIAF